MKQVATHNSVVQNGKWQRLISAGCISLLIIWLGLYVFVLATTYHDGELFVAVKLSEIVSDYLFWYVPGLVAASPQSHQLYDLNALLPFWNQVVTPVHLTLAPANVYPPYFALMFIPFSQLPLISSYLLWTGLWLTLGWCALTALLKSRQTFSTGEIIAFLIVATVAPPSLTCIRIGQLSWCILTLVVFFFYCFRQRREYLAGIALAFLSIKPHYFLFFVIPALVDKRWKILAAFGIVEAIFMIASGFVVGWSNIIGYPSVLLNRDATAPAIEPQRMISCRVLFNAFLPSSTAQSASMIVMLLALATLVFIWHRTLKTRPELSNWAMSVTVIACLVASPHTHLYDALLLALPAAITLDTANLFAAFRLKDLTARVWNLTFIAYAITASFGFVAFTSLFREKLSPVILACNLLLLCGAATILFLRLRTKTSIETAPEPSR